MGEPPLQVHVLVLVAVDAERALLDEGPGREHIGREDRELRAVDGTLEHPLRVAMRDSGHAERALVRASSCTASAGRRNGGSC